MIDIVSGDLDSFFRTQYYALCMWITVQPTINTKRRSKRFVFTKDKVHTQKLQERNLKLQEAHMQLSPQKYKPCHLKKIKTSDSVMAMASKHLFCAYVILMISTEVTLQQARYT